MAFDKKAYAEKMKKQVDDTINDAKKAVLDFQSDPVKVMEYLDFMSKAYQYSPRNQVLIKHQYMEAGFIAGENQFKDNMGLKVRKGEEPIKVLAPVFRKMIITDKGEKVFKFATKEEKELVKQNKLKTKNKLHYYKFVEVFDITQTNAVADDYPDYFPNKREIFFTKSEEAMKRVYQATKEFLKENNIEVVENATNQVYGASKGMSYTRISDDHRQREIGLRAGLSDSEKVSTLIHETLHAIEHQNDKRKGLTVEQKELEAELTAYTVSKHFGIDTKDSSIKYVALWTENFSNIKDVEKSLNVVSEQSKRLISYIEEKIDPKLIKDFYNIDEVKREEQISEAKSRNTFKTYTQDEIADAKDNSILSVANSKGIILENNKKFFTQKDDKNILFYPKKNTYFNKSTKKGGNVINYLKNEHDMSFSEAIDYLHNLKQEKEKAKNEIKKKQADFVTKEQIEDAKSKNILDVAGMCGYSFKKSGKSYIGIEHDSLVLTPSKNMYSWFSKNEFGTPIQFIQREKGLSFQDSVRFLNGEDLKNIDSKAIVEEKEKYDVSSHEYKDKTNMQRSFLYLVDKRKIDSDLVNKLIDEDLIKEDKRGNVTFIWKDHEGNAVGSDKRGTSKQQYRGIDSGSDSLFGFNFQLGENPKNIYVFESAIDAMSYKTMNKDAEGIFVSMSGLKEKTILRHINLYMKKYGKDPENVYISVDNDEPANEFIKNLTPINSNLSQSEINYVPNQPDKHLGKDWNEALTNTFDGKPAEKKPNNNPIKSEKRNNKKMESIEL